LKPRSKKDAKTTCSLTSSLGNYSPAAALHSTSTFGRRSPQSIRAWIFASVIVDRTHAVCGSRMEAASAVISLLRLVLGLMLQRVLTRMRKRSATRSGSASTWLAGARGWTGARVGTRWSEDRRTATEAEATAAGGRRKGNGVNPASGRLIYRGSTESARCGSFRRTTRLNGSILKSSRADQGGFSLTDYSYDLNSEFKSSAKQEDNIRSS
jgi:hypothetical protein